MPRKPIEFSLDFIKKDIFSRFSIKQFDDVSFNITPMIQNKPYDTTNMIGKIYVGVNNDMFKQDTNITVSNNNINVILDKNMIQKHGRAYAEIELTDSNGTITSSSFVFDIEPKIGEGATIPGEFEGFVAKYEKLIAKFKSEVDSNLLENNNKIDTLIKDTNSKIDTYKVAKDTEINQSLETYKTNTTADIQTYKGAKDNEINKNLETFKSNTTKDIELYKSTKDTEIDTYKTSKDTEINNYKNEKNNELDISENKRVSDENIRVGNENKRVNDENIRISNENARILDENTRIVEHKKNITDTNNKIVEVENRFQTLTVKQQQDAEVIDARDNEISLKARLERDLAKGKIINETVEGNYITVKDSVGGYIDNIEILGNTIQGVDLSDIQSVGTLREDGLYDMSILSCGKNLFNPFNSKYTYSKVNSIDKVAHSVDSNGIITLTSKGMYDWGFVEFNDISVPIGKIMCLHPNAEITKGNISAWVYDSNGIKLSEAGNTTQTFISTTGKITIRLYVQTTTTYADVIVKYKPQLEEGTVATSYEPYQENKSKIILPCQLEKVGTIGDRLFRRGDGVWCIEKDINDLILNGSETNFYLASSQPSNTDLINIYYSKFTEARIVTDVICNKFKGLHTQNDNNSEGVHRGGENNVHFIINKSKLTSADITGFKTWLSQNPTLVKYQLATPQIIELPLDVQISLNSFLGTTNIFTEDTVIEPTIKCTIPKSLGASIQSLNEKTDIISDRVEKVETLQKSNELEISTDKGYVVCENTNNGYVEDLKIEGNTLVNLATNPKGTSSSVKYITLSKAQVKPSTKYTIIANVSEGVILNDNNGYFTNINNGIKTITTKDTSTELSFLKNSDTSSTITYEFIILEGDHTQNPPSYFEGLKSVGDGAEKIEVLSRNNILTYKENFILGEKCAEPSKPLDTNAKDSTCVGSINKIPCLPNQTLYFKVPEGYSYIIAYANKQGVVIGQNVWTNTKTLKLPNNCYYFKYALIKTNGRPSLTQQDFEIIKDNFVISTNSYIEGEFKQNKKQILYQTKEGNYEKPILRSAGNVSDTIEKHSDGKYYFHKRCGEIALKGSGIESWTHDTVNSSSTIGRFNFNNIGMLGNRSSLVSDKYTLKKDYTLANNNVEGMFTSIGGSTLVLDTLYSKLSTKDVAGFKAGLQSNPVTVVYQLAIEEVYECINLDLDSYEGETSVIFDGGTISPKISFKIASHIGNTISVLKDKINYLEDKVITMFKNVLAGDVQSLAYELYPKDFEKEEDVIDESFLVDTEVIDLN